MSFLPKLPSQIFSLADFIFFFIFPFFAFSEFFFVSTDTRTTQLVQAMINLANLPNVKVCLSIWVMAALIGQILHFGKAEGWMFSNRALTNVSKENVKSLFLIKHLTPEKRDIPSFYFSFDYWFSLFSLLLFFWIMNLVICEKTNDSKRDNRFFISFCSFLETPFIHMRWDVD